MKIQLNPNREQILKCQGQLQNDSFRPRTQNTCQAGRTKKKKLSSSCSTKNLFLQNIPVKAGHSSPFPTPVLRLASLFPFTLGFHAAHREAVPYCNCAHPATSLPGALKKHEKMYSREPAWIPRAWRWVSSLHWAPLFLRMLWGRWPPFLQISLEIKWSSPWKSICCIVGIQ